MVGKGGRNNKVFKGNQEKELSKYLQKKFRLKSSEPQWMYEAKKYKPNQKISKQEWGKIAKFNKHIGKDGTHYVSQLTNKGTTLVPVVVEVKLINIRIFLPCTHKIDTTTMHRKFITSRKSNISIIISIC